VIGAGRATGEITAREPDAPAQRDIRLDGRGVRVSTPVPADIWRAVATADPSATPFQWPAWRDCVCGDGGWRDASQLYELPGSRQLVVMLARRPAGHGRLAVEASWPAGWGCGGIVAPGGVRPEEVSLVSADLAARRALSVTVRPGFSGAASWQRPAGRGLVIPRSVHVATFDGSFDDYLAGSVTAKKRGSLRNARRHLAEAGVVITSGNSPALVRALYDVYLTWIDWRAVQRRMPIAVARWKAARAEPREKFARVAATLGEGCRIWVAWWDGRPIAATMSLLAGESAVGWRAFTDRSAPARFRLFETLAMEVLRHACESGCRRVELGESVGKRDLAAVKERLGGQEAASPEFCFQRLPLAQARLAFEHVRGQAEEWIITRMRALGIWH
jgi:hypothetical protein